MMDWKRSRSWVAEDLGEDFGFPEGSLWWKKQHSASSGSGSTLDDNLGLDRIDDVDTLRSPYSRQSTDAAVKMMGALSRSQVEGVLRDVVANSGECVSVADYNLKDEDSEGIFVAVSETFAELTGYLTDEMVGKSWRFLSCNNGHESDPFTAFHMRLACQRGTPFTALRTNRRKTGELFLNMFHIRGLSVAQDENSEPEPWFLLGVHTDATEACAEDEEKAQSFLEEQADKVLNQVQSRLMPLLKQNPHGDQ